MPYPMVRWYHLIVTAYGFWLPNDPRGSWSEFVGAWELYKFGPATKTNEKRSLAHDPHDRSLRMAAKQALKYPPVRFDAAQRHATSERFALAIRKGDYLVHACCIGHDHAHLVVARHARTIEKIATHLKSKATLSLNRNEIHPLERLPQPRRQHPPTPWAAGIWSVFIDNEPHLASAIRYVERHPKKDDLPEKMWDFVTPREV